MSIVKFCFSDIWIRRGRPANNPKFVAVRDDDAKPWFVPFASAEARWRNPPKPAAPAVVSQPQPAPEKPKPVEKAVRKVVVRPHPRHETVHIDPHEHEISEQEVALEQEKNNQNQYAVEKLPPQYPSKFRFSMDGKKPTRLPGTSHKHSHKHKHKPAEVATALDVKQCRDNINYNYSICDRLQLLPNFGTFHIFLLELNNEVVAAAAPVAQDEEDSPHATSSDTAPRESSVDRQEEIMIGNLHSNVEKVRKGVTDLHRKVA